MKAEEQRIKIAEACGWTVRPDLSMYCNDKFGCADGTVPDYLNDLNAMHEAEKVLNTNQAADYCELLRPIICGCWRLVHATAAQRAEAFLKTLNLWTST